MPAAQKRARADLVIDNDGSLEALQHRADRAWQTILAHASA
jgi:dephospho-CoA kinase